MAMSTRRGGRRACNNNAANVDWGTVRILDPEGGVHAYTVHMNAHTNTCRICVSAVCADDRDTALGLASIRPVY